MNDKSILIIDSNPGDIQEASSILSTDGYEVIPVMDFMTAGGRLEDGGFDLILIDVTDSNADSFELCRVLKEDPRFREIPLIFTTSRPDCKELAMGFEVGGDDYVTKPYSSKELLKKVRNHLDLKSYRTLLGNTDKTLDLAKVNKELELSVNELKRTNEELSRLEKSKQQFLDILGSELSGALNEITAMLQVIKYKVDSKKVAQLVDHIDHSMSKIEIYVEAALRISELQSLGSVIKPERVDAGKLIGFAMFSLDEKIRRKMIHINNQTSSRSVFITGESQLLKAAMVIILDFFMERNLPDASIDIDVRSNTRGISIIFKDNGASVSEQEISSYLDNFYPGQSLNFAAMIAESHLGKLSVANRDDSQGIVIDFSLYIE